MNFMSKYKDIDRKYEYLLKEAHFTDEELNKYFQKIDDLMKKVSVGTILYEFDPFDGAYSWKVTKIINKDMGIIELLEESTGKIQKTCVLGFNFSFKEAAKYSMIGANL